MSSRYISIVYKIPAQGIIMTNQRLRVAQEDRLRLVFDDAVVALDLKYGITFGEIAELCGAVACRHEGAPVAIDVMLGQVVPMAVIAAASMARAPRRPGTVRHG